MIIIIRKIGEAQPPKPSARTFAVDGTYGERIPLRAQAIHTDKIRQPWRGYVPPYAVAITCFNGIIPLFFVGIVARSEVRWWRLRRFIVSFQCSERHPSRGPASGNLPLPAVRTFFYATALRRPFRPCQARFSLRSLSHVSRRRQLPYPSRQNPRPGFGASAKSGSPARQDLHGRGALGHPSRRRKPQSWSREGERAV